MEQQWYKRQTGREEKRKEQEPSTIEEAERESRKRKRAADLREGISGTEVETTEEGIGETSSRTESDSREER